MEFKHSTSILFSNMGYILKILVWVLIALLLTAAVGAGLLIPIYNVYDAKTDINADINAIEQTVAKFLHDGNGIYDFVVQLRDQSIDLLRGLVEYSGTFVGLVFALLFLYSLYSFLIGMSLYPTADMVNKIMSSNMRFGFSASMAANFRKACKYSLCKLTLTLPIDILVCGILFGVGYGLLLCIKVFALPILLALGITLFAFRSVLYAGWLPRLLFHPEEGYYTAFKRSLVAVKFNFKGLIKSYVIIYFIAYTCMAAFTIPTFGLINLVMPASYYFLLRAVELIGYYKTNSLSFYVDASNVIDTVEYGYRKINQEEVEE